MHQKLAEAGREMKKAARKEARSGSLLVELASLSLLPLLLLLSFGCLFHPSCGQTVQPTVAAAAAEQVGTLKFELKFQSEVDNSTILKQENQQQIFKCQVRLAPINSAAIVGLDQQQATKRSRLTTSIKLAHEATGGDFSSQQQQQQNNGEAGQAKWPANVSLTVDWFKDSQPLVGQTNGDLISVLNVELKNTASSSSSNSSLKNDKRNKPRIEVKNTSNGNQLKLTSRLRIGQLKLQDSGHYKCLARASYQAPLVGAFGPVLSAPAQAQASTGASASGVKQQQQQLQLQQRAAVYLIEQTLESNSAILSVQSFTSPAIANDTAGGKDFLEARLAAAAAGSTDANERQHAIRKPAASQPPPPPKAKGQPASHDDNQDSRDQIRPPPPLLQSKVPQTNQQQQRPHRDNGASGNTRSYSIGQSQGQPDDDEDPSRQIGGLLASNFISSDAGPMKTPANDVLAAAAAAANNDDDEDTLRWRPLLPSGSSGGGAQMGTGINDWPEMELSPSSRDVGGGDGDTSDNNESLPDQLNRYQQQNIRPHNHHNRPRNGPSHGNLGATRDESAATATDKYFNSDRLLKLVHKIAPELACYTGTGEHYRGSLAKAADGRHCLAWPEAHRQLAASGLVAAAAAVGAIFRERSAFSTADDDDDIYPHSYCRNPTLDPRGPWCFVPYESALDDRRAASTAYEATQAPTQSVPIIIGTIQELANNNSNNNGSGSKGSGSRASNASTMEPRYIQRHCSVAPCSEYLWLYIVAPPLGFLMLLSCLITLMVRYVRAKSHYSTSPAGSGSSCSVRRAKSSLLGIRRLLINNGGPGCGGGGGATKFSLARKFGSAAAAACAHKKSCGRYLDDDIFEIVDDIDWSDGTTAQSLSPKSSESLKLSPTSIASHEQLRQTKQGKGGQQQASGFNRSTVSQVGPMFATLRCQVRNGLKASGQHRGLGTLSKMNKSSTFIEQSSAPLDSQTQNGTTKWLNAAGNNGSMSPRTTTTTATSRQQQQQSTMEPDLYGSQQASHCSSMAATNSGHLISCSSTADDIESSSFGGGGEKYTRASDLPLLSGDSISIAPNQQPLYEGKFSQVQLAFVKRSTKANKNSDNDLESAAAARNGDIGTQVALCSLKASANIDQSIFEPANLKLRNLNHLNILKLIGYATQTENEIGLKRDHEYLCSLVFDMGQLVDLTDWLRQQSKDVLVSCEPGNQSGTRRNLTCFAKQIALAVDYLHDRGIVFKDLACRNCFLDPTKMLIKLASFNLEFANNNSLVCDTDELQSLRSMIRPKYLLDYYVIDSRPSDSQLLPLSWIPLESILFNKFNMQTDVWSFGCLIYELFSLGEVAYFGYSSKQVIDAVRSNLMPPQPLLCSNGIYKLMCKCLSDIPSTRPNVKQIYEQLNLYSGQCSSFLDHHLCSLVGGNFDEQQQAASQMVAVATSFKTNACNSQSSGQGSITKTKSYANIKNFVPTSNARAQDIVSSRHDLENSNSDLLNRVGSRPEVAKIPLSKSINLTGNRLMSFGGQSTSHLFDTNHYDEPITDCGK